MVDNKKTTTYTVTKEDGTKMVETVVKNKETGEVKHFVDGEEVKAEEQESGNVEKKESPKKESSSPLVRYNVGNGELLQIKVLEMIVNQWKEINYYVRRLAEKSADKDGDKVRKAING